MLTIALVRVRSVYRRHGVAVGLGLAILFLAVAAPLVSAENIFDADGIQPKASGRVDDARGASVAVVRKPIPSATDLARSRALLMELFAEPLKDATPAGRRRLAETLLAESVKTTDNPGDQYAMLLASVKAAEAYGSVPLCFKAIDVLAKSFQVDAAATKSVVVFSIGLKVDSAADTDANLKAAVPLVEELVECGDYDGALKLCAILKPLAQGELAARLAKRVQEIRGTADLFALLRTKPDDLALNLAAGRYHCFASGQWAKGLPFLAKGSDTALAKAASNELAGAASASDAERVGVEWWKVAESLNEADRSVVRRHAATLFAVSLPKTTGLSRKLLEKRIAEASAAALIPGSPETTRLSADATEDARRIVFVLDATGSMMSSYDVLRAKFREQVTALGPTQRFDVLMMNDHKASPLFADLIATTVDNKRKALEFADTMAPRGGTDAAPFLKRAIDLKPERIYLLIDPTDFERKDRTAMLALVRNSTGKKIPLEIIAFEETPESLEFCKSLAEQSGGTYHRFNSHDINSRVR
jgi:hypothetical protein